MRTYIILLFLFFCQVSFALTPKETELVMQMQGVIKDLRAKLTDTQVRNDEALKALSSSSFQIAQLIEQARLANETMGELMVERDALSEKLATFQVKYDKLNHKYQTAQLIIALLAAFFVGLITLQFTHNLQPPYGLLVPVFAGAAVFFTIYIVL